MSTAPKASTAFCDDLVGRRPAWSGRRRGRRSRRRSRSAACSATSPSRSLISTLRALAGEQLGGGAADAARRAGDDRRFAVKKSHRSAFSFSFVKSARRLHGSGAILVDWPVGSRSRGSRRPIGDEALPPRGRRPLVPRPNKEARTWSPRVPRHFLGRLPGPDAEPPHDLLPHLRRDPDRDRARRCSPRHLRQYGTTTTPSTYAAQGRGLSSCPPS